MLTSDFVSVIILTFGYYHHLSGCDDKIARNRQLHTWYEMSCKDISRLLSQQLLFVEFHVLLLRFNKNLLKQACRSPLEHSPPLTEINRKTPSHFSPVTRRNQPK